MIQRVTISLLQIYTVLHAELCLCPADSYLPHAEFKSDHTSNSVRVLSSFHQDQVRHQQESSNQNRYFYATLEYSHPQGQKALHIIQKSMSFFN